MDFNLIVGEVILILIGVFFGFILGKLHGPFKKIQHK